MMPMKQWPTVAAVGLFLIVFAMMSYWIVYVPGYAELWRSAPVYVAQSYRTLIGVIVVFLLAHALLRTSDKGVLETLGLTRSPLPGFAAALAMVLPLYVVFAFSYRIAAIAPLEVLFIAILSPFGEELAFRGFAFAFLRRIAGWGFWPAALAPAVVFGIGHVFQAADAIGLIVNLLLIGLGSILFAWLFEKWSGLWAPFALHALMNLHWTVFAVGEDAGILPYVMQGVTVALAVLLTVFRTRILSLQPSSFWRQAQKWVKGERPA
ncbi:MAG: CPBP family intramembrane glutamic endopeptidase [bacterium]